MTSERWYDADILAQHIEDFGDETPDGLVVDGRLYPYMVDCGECGGDGRYKPLADDIACTDCEGGKVRNPNLEWSRFCVTWGEIWRPDEDHQGVRICARDWGQHDHEDCRWVAVGVA